MPPIPVTAYDPSRRIFIGGLPPNTTTKDIIATIKQRTKAQPTHVEIALAKKVNTKEKERDVLAPAPPITRRRKPKFKIAGLSSSSDDDEILEWNNKKKTNNNNGEDGEDEDEDKENKPQGGKNKNKNNSKNKNDDDDEEEDNNNNNEAVDEDDDGTAKKKKGGGGGGAKKPMRECRGFAHVTVEGLKSVVEQLKGTLVHDKQIYVGKAKPHYLWRIERVRREAEKVVDKKKEEVDAITSKEGYGELDYTKPPLRSMDAAKKKFGTIASQIAAKLRQQAKERKQKMLQFSQNRFGAASAGNKNFVDNRRRQRDDDGAKGGPSNKAAPVGKGAKPFNSADQNKNKNNKNSKSAPAKAVPPPPPPEPTKTDRKLSALEARLAALHAKLAKK